MELIKKTLSERKIIFISVLILVLLFFLILNFIKEKPNIDLYKQVKINSETPIAEATILDVKKEVGSGLPINLKIPIIKIDATVEYMGLTEEGAMDTPKEPSFVGWYKFGPKPGEIGNSVIDGHSGWKGQIPAVFDNLYKIKIGDKIYVLDDKGVTITFIVYDIQIYNPETDASKVFLLNDGKSHLNLITCTGSWNNILKSHSSRLVIFSDRELK